MYRTCLFLSAVLLLASCTLEDGTTAPDVATVPAPAVSVAFTRASAGTGNMVACAYRPGGLLEACASGSAESVSMSVTCGVSLDVLVACGLPSGMSAPAATLDAMLSRELSLSSQADVRTAVAVERGISISSDSVITCRPSRIASCVSLDTITCMRPGGLTIVRAYLSNICGTCPLSGQAADDGVWYCRMGDCSDCTQDVRPLLVRDLSVSLDKGASFVAGLSFLLFPNPSDSNAAWPTDTVWCPRPSRLVLECVNSGRTVWYPVTLPSVQSNTDLHVSHLVISGEGTSHPDWPVDRVSTEFTVEVLPWDYASSSIKL